MILADTGPLVALIDRSDPYQDRCGEIVALLRAEVMLTTWQCCRWQCWMWTSTILSSPGNHTLVRRYSLVLVISW